MSGTPPSARRPLPAGARFLPALAMAPIAVPGIVMGVGLFLVYSRPPFLLYGTLWILAIAIVPLEMPAGFLQVQAHCAACMWNSKRPPASSADRSPTAPAAPAVWPVLEVGPAAVVKVALMMVPL